MKEAVVAAMEEKGEERKGLGFGETGRGLK